MIRSARDSRSVRIADACGDPDLSALARLALGRVLIFRGDVSRGVRLLDEAMVAVVAGETSPIVVGDSFCTAIDACHDVFDVRRGQAWTAAFGRWCDTQPDLVPYAGLCLVHRAEFLQLKGAWGEAMAQAGLARKRLSAPVVQPSLGAAIYQQGELLRLRGRFDDAERHYREAAVLGTPVWSVFEGKPGAIDELLVREGRLRLLHSPEEIAVERKSTPPPAGEPRRDPADLLRLAQPGNI